MAETRDFPTAVVASLATGTLLCKSFGDVHEAATFLMGHPIFTHHFANEDLWKEIKQAILVQCPGMPTEVEGGPDWRDQLAKIEAEIGKTVRLRKGDGLTAMLPTDGIPEGMEVIEVAMQPGKVT